MNKYTTLLNDVFSIFADASWQAENIKTYPNDVLVSGVQEYIRVTIVPSGNGISENSVSGLLLAEIYSASNAGPKRAAEIADKLDKYLAKRSISTVSGKMTQFLYSNFVPKGVDKDDASLVKSLFSIPFNHFGVQ